MKIYLALLFLLSASIASASCDNKDVCILFVSAETVDDRMFKLQKEWTEMAIKVYSNSENYSLTNVGFDGYQNRPYDLVLFGTALSNINNYANSYLSSALNSIGLSPEKFVGKFIYGGATQSEISTIQNIVGAEVYSGFLDSTKQLLLSSSNDSILLTNKISALLENEKKVVTLPYSTGTILDNKSFNIINNSAISSKVKNYGTVHLANVAGVAMVANDQNLHLTTNLDLVTSIIQPNFNIVNDNDHRFDPFNHYLLETYMSIDVYANSTEDPNFTNKNMANNVSLSIFKVIDKLGGEPKPPVFTGQIETLASSFGDLYSIDDQYGNTAAQFKAVVDKSKNIYYQIGYTQNGTAKIYSIDASSGAFLRSSVIIMPSGLGVPQNIFLDSDGSLLGVRNNALVSFSLNEDSHVTGTATLLSYLGGISSLKTDSTYYDPSSGILHAIANKSTGGKGYFQVSKDGSAVQRTLIDNYPTSPGWISSEPAGIYKKPDGNLVATVMDIRPCDWISEICPEPPVHPIQRIVSINIATPDVDTGAITMETTKAHTGSNVTRGQIAQERLTTAYAGDEYHIIGDDIYNINFDLWINPDLFVFNGTSGELSYFTQGNVAYDRVPSSIGFNNQLGLVGMFGHHGNVQFIKFTEVESEV